MSFYWLSSISKLIKWWPLMHSLISIPRYTSINSIIGIIFLVIIVMTKFNFHSINGILKDYKVTLHSAWIWNSVLILSGMKLGGKCHVNRESVQITQESLFMEIRQSGKYIFLKVQMFSMSDCQNANSWYIWKSFFS